MVKFLLERPIAVIMAFLAAVIVGLASYFSIPVSLLPAIDIPEITVRITGDNMSARQLENAVTGPIRRWVQQVEGVDEISSETRDGSAVIRMGFEYGVDIDLAFIAVNEKIDAAMNMLPRDMQRPKVVKASATDIPVLYLTMTLKDSVYDARGFRDLGKVAESIVRRRLELLPEVAMVDVTGVPELMVCVQPDRHMTEAAGITDGMIADALRSANSSPGAMTVREGYYEYNVGISNNLRTPEDVADIYINHAGKLIRLGDVATVTTAEREPDGISSYNGKRAVTLAVIKNNEEGIDGMKDVLGKVISEMEELYPMIEFSISRNQTDLLDFTISNLVQNLLLGLLLVFLITVIFMGDLRSPFVIGITIVVALVLTFLMFYLCHVSLNVVSLSGLILAVGMMIDNSTIVTENITQWRQRGLSLTKACDRGTTEMITPLLSSSLTTVAVFVPLVFMSGIAGAIFTDQAFSITVGLAMSYLSGILLLPVLYRLFFRKRGDFHKSWRMAGSIERVMERGYDRGIASVFRHKVIWLLITALTFPVCYLMFRTLRVERMPALDHVETIARVEWNENINAVENDRRVGELLGEFSNSIAESAAAAGVQDYLLEAGNDLTSNDAEVYIRCESVERLNEVMRRIKEWTGSNYPTAQITFSPPDNIFEKIFTSSEPELMVRLTPGLSNVEMTPESYSKIVSKIATGCGAPDEVTAIRKQSDIRIDNRKLALYKIDRGTVEGALRDAFKQESVTTLRSFSEYLPLTIGGKNRNLETILSETMVRTRGSNELIPLREVVSVRNAYDFSELTAGKNGEYLPVTYASTSGTGQLISHVDETLREEPAWDYELTGAFFSNSKMMGEMVVILLVSVALMYFILCAQFESFVQPLIVLLEIPLDTAFALIMLWLTGNSLNIMSAIGIVVTCGIVVNDSILKLDAINTLRKEGMPLQEAIHTAGLRRLRPIVMTSLTTMLAMVPLLFTNDIGSQLQRPLAIAMIGSMAIGTLVSIFIIPLVYSLVVAKGSLRK